MDAGRVIAKSLVAVSPGSWNWVVIFEEAFQFIQTNTAEAVVHVHLDPRKMKSTRKQGPETLEGMHIN